jgi:predicted PurR-regulated permease PerM
MKNNPERPATLEDKSFLLLLTLVTLAFGWVMLPFYGALFWAAVLAIIFAPLHARLTQRLPHKRNLTAVISLSLIVLLVVLPLILVSAMLVQEASVVYARMQSGEISFTRYLQQMYEALPAWLSASPRRSWASQALGRSSATPRQCGGLRGHSPTSPSAMLARPHARPPALRPRSSLSPPSRPCAAARTRQSRL